MPEFRKVTPGEPLRIPATDYNAFVDAAKGFREKPHKNNRPFSVMQQAGVVLVKNDSGSSGDVDRFAVLGIDDFLISPNDNLEEFQSRVMFSGVTPSVDSDSEDDHEGRFVITLEPIAAGSIGLAVASGVVQVQVNITDASHHWAECKNGDSTQLESATWGSCRILMRESGTGTKWAIVRMSERLPEKDCET